MSKQYFTAMLSTISTPEQSWWGTNYVRIYFVNIGKTKIVYSLGRKKKSLSIQDISLVKGDIFITTKNGSKYKIVEIYNITQREYKHETLEWSKRWGYYSPFPKRTPANIILKD